MCFIWKTDIQVKNSNQGGGYTQRAIRNKEYKLIWTPKQENDYYLGVMMAPQSGKTFAKAWREWQEKAKTDPDAQAKIDRVTTHPEFELYNIEKDLWELDNLARNPEYLQIVEELHARLKNDMEMLNDSFSTNDPKQEKKKNKGKSEKKADRQAKKK